MNDAQQAYLKMVAVLGDMHEANPTAFTNEILVHNYMFGGLNLVIALVSGIITYLSLVHLKDIPKHRCFVGFFFLLTLLTFFYGVTTITRTYFSPRLVILEHLGTLEK